MPGAAQIMQRHLDGRLRNWLAAAQPRPDVPVHHPVHRPPVLGLQANQRRSEIALAHVCNRLQSFAAPAGARSCLPLAADAVVRRNSHIDMRRPKAGFPDGPLGIVNDWLIGRRRGNTSITGNFHILIPLDSFRRILDHIILDA